MPWIPVVSAPPFDSTALDESSRPLLALVVRHEVDRQGHRQRRLADDRARRKPSDEFVGERRAEPVGEVDPARCVPAEVRRHPCHDDRIQCPIRSREQRLGRSIPDGQPVAVVVVQSVSPDQIRVGAFEPVHERNHRWVMAIESVEVCIVTVHGPRDEDPSIGPSRCTVDLDDHLRRDVRERTGSRLPVADGDQPLVEERSGVVDVIDDRRDELRVGHPPESLVALWAIGWDGDGVAANRPQHVVVQPVRRLVGALRRFRSDEGRWRPPRLERPPQRAAAGPG